MASHQRKHERVDSLNLLSYFCVDEQGEVIAQGMGRTLNVSEGGILLETHIQLETEYAVFLSIGFQDEVTDVKGKIKYSAMGDNERWRSGIEFAAPDTNAQRIIKKYIDAFTRQQAKTEELGE